jgi:hypothetical protein
MNKTPLLLFLVLVSVAFAKLIGGLSEERPATEEVQHIALKVRPDIESKLGLQSESTFEVVRYKTQVCSLLLVGGDFVTLTEFRLLPA